jgi:adenine specific DNA methylase Mod
MLKYKTEFEEHKLKEQQKEKEQQEENRAKYGPAKTTMQTLYDNAGSIAGGAGGVFSIGKTIYDVASSVKKATDLSPNTINNVANVATKVYKTAETVSDVSGLLSPSQKKRQKAREQLIKKAVSQTLSEVEKGYISSTEGYYKRGGGRYVESFSNQEVSNTGFSNN